MDGSELLRAAFPLGPRGERGVAVLQRRHSAKQNQLLSRRRRMRRVQLSEDRISLGFPLLLIVI